MSNEVPVNAFAAAKNLLRAYEFWIFPTPTAARFARCI